MYSDPSDDLGQSCSHYEAVSSSSSMYEDDFAVIPTTIAYEDMFEGQQQQGQTQQGQTQHCVEDNFMEDALPALPSCSGRNWNDDWQAVVLSSALTPEEQEERQRKLLDISREFCTAAEPVARVIAEQARRLFQKRIQSVDAGGIAGGVKFVHDGIFFKQAVSQDAIYSDEGAALKAAGRELLALRAVLACNVVGLSVPLMATVDCCDAGQTVLTGESAGVAQVFKSLSDALNLAEHGVVTDKRLPLAVDVEGHIGKDGRVYICDVQRVFPPDPSPLFGKTKGRTLYIMLRPELVAMNPESLSSDAFSSFVGKSDDDTMHKDRVRAAQRRLVDSFPFLLVEMQTWLTGEAEGPLSQGHLVELVKRLHAHGVNLRYMGVLLQLAIEKDYTKSAAALATEIAARAAKAEIFKLWRTAQGPRAALRVLKEFLDSSALDQCLSEQQWTFPGVTGDCIRAHLLGELRKPRLLAMVGVSASETLESIVKVVDPPESVPAERMLQIIDAEIRVRSPVSPAAALAPAFSAKAAALLALHQNAEALNWAMKGVFACVDKTDATVEEAAARILEEEGDSARKLARKLVFAIAQASRVVLATARTATSFEEGHSWAVLSSQLALRYDLGRDVVAERLLCVSEFMYQLERFDECIATVRQALALFDGEKDYDQRDPWLGRILYTLSRVLVKIHREDECESLYERSVAVLKRTRGPQHSTVGDALHSLARLKHKQGKLSEATTAFEEAAGIKKQALGENHASVAKTLANLASVYIDQKRVQEADLLLNQVTSIQTACSGYECGDNARTLLHRAHLTNSLELLQESLRIGLLVWPESHSHVVKVRKEIAQRGDVPRAEALRHLQTAIRALEAEKGERVAADLTSLRKAMSKLEQMESMSTNITE